MSHIVPTLPDATTQDKRVRTSSRERVDATDFKNIGALLTQRMANWFRSNIAEDVDMVLRGFRTTQNTGSDMNVKVQPESGDPSSTALQGGYLLKETAASVILPIDSEASLTNRIDIVSIRYVEDETDSAVRPILSEATVTFVDDEAPGTGIGDGTTALFDLSVSGVVAETLIARVGGVPVAAVVVPGTGSTGKDQVAFGQAPASGAPIRLDFYYMTGGVEQNVSTLTRFTSIVEYVVTKGVANGVEPSTPAGYMKIARISGITTSTTAITNGMITKLRRFVYGNESPGVFDQAAGSLQQFIASYGFMRNGWFPTINLLAAVTLNIRRTVNATDYQALMAWYKRGSASVAPTVVDRIGKVRRKHKHWREDWQNISVDTGGTDTSKRWKADSTAGGPGVFQYIAAPNNGKVRIRTTGTSGDDTRLQSWFDVRITGTGEGLAYYSHLLALEDVASLYMQLGFATTSQFVVGFEIDPTAGLGGITNWVANVVTAGPTNNRVDTGIAASTAERFFEVIQIDADDFVFLIDGTPVATRTFTPIATDVRIHTYLKTNTGSARNVHSKLIEADLDPY